MPPQLTRKELKIGANSYLIRQLVPIDFIGRPGGCPVSMFIVAREKTKYEQMLEASGGSDTNNSTDQQLEVIRSVLGVGVLRRNGLDFNVDTYLATETDIVEMLQVFGEIISLSFSFASPLKTNKDQLMQIDIIAQRYGIQPIDVVMPGGGYTPLDAFTFNATVASEGLNNRNQLAKNAKLEWMVALN